MAVLISRRARSGALTIAAIAGLAGLMAVSAPARAQCGDSIALLEHKIALIDSARIMIGGDTALGPQVAARNSGQLAEFETRLARSKQFLSLARQLNAESNQQACEAIVADGQDAVTAARAAFTGLAR